MIDFVLFLVHRYYAWDYRVLKTFARHYSTGEEIPQKLVESMQGARDMFSATSLQRQVFLYSQDDVLSHHIPVLFVYEIIIKLLLCFLLDLLFSS